MKPDPDISVTPYSDSVFLAYLSSGVTEDDLHEFSSAVPDFDGKTKGAAHSFAAEPMQTGEFVEECKLEFTDGMEHMLHLASGDQQGSPYRDTYFAAMSLHYYGTSRSFFSDDIASLASLTIASSMPFHALKGRALCAGFLLSRVAVCSLSDREGAVGCLVLLSAFSLTADSLMDANADAPKSIHTTEFDAESVWIWTQIVRIRNRLAALASEHQDKVLAHLATFNK